MAREIESFSDAFIFNDGVTSYTSIIELDSTHICITYRDSNGYRGTSIIGTIDGQSISWGDECISAAVNTEFISAIKLDSTHICVIFRDGTNSNDGTAIIGTISGNNISWGSPSVFYTGNCWRPKGVVLDSTHICVGYIGTKGACKIGTISGNNISWGTEQLFNIDTTNNYFTLVKLDSTHVHVNYQNASNSNYGTSVIGTVTGDNISWGSTSIFNESGTEIIETNILSDTKICVSYRDKSNSDYGTSNIGTISEGVVSWGPKHVFNTGAMYELKSTTLDNNNFSIIYNDGANDEYGTIIIGTISGDDISWSTPSVFNAAATTHRSSTLIDSSRLIISYNDVSNSGYGTIVIAELNAAALEGTPYVRPDLITGLYSIGSRGNLRGKAAEGFIRPTIKQFFTSYPDFKEVIPAPTDHPKAMIQPNNAVIDTSSITQLSNIFPSNLMSPHTYVNDTYIWLIGANTTSNNIMRTSVNTPESGWSVVGTIPGGDYRWSTACIVGDYYYIFGGQNKNTIIRAPLNDLVSWETVGNAPTNAAGGWSYVSDNYVYWGTGYTSSNYYKIPIADLHNKNLGAITTIADVTTTHSTHQMFKYKDYYYLIGWGSWVFPDVGGEPDLANPSQTHASVGFATPNNSVIAINDELYFANGVNLSKVSTSDLSTITGNYTLPFTVSYGSGFVVNNNLYLCGSYADSNRHMIKIPISNAINSPY